MPKKQRLIQQIIPCTADTLPLDHTPRERDWDAELEDGYYTDEPDTDAMGNCYSDADPGL